MMTYKTLIPINEKTMYLMEAMKVEGYWKTGSYTLTIQNKNLPFLNYIEKIAKELRIKPARRILLKIKLEDNTQKEEVKIKTEDNEISFHIEKSPFDNKKVKAVTSLPYKKNYEFEIFIKNKKYKLKVKSRKNKFILNGDIISWVYGDLRFPVKALLEFLDLYGGNKKSLRISEIIKSDEKLIFSAFSALMDCEGSINWYGLKRVISIRMKSKNYLKEWSDLLNSLGIGCKFSKRGYFWELNISGWEDFNKLENRGLKLNHSQKDKKWKKMMDDFKRKQISRNSYKEFYMNRIKEFGKTTASELAKRLGKSKRVINHHLLRLEKKRLIYCDKTNKPYIYFISTSSVR